MGLKEEVLRGIYGYGFTKPSPIQQKGILPVIQGNDTIAQVSITQIKHPLKLLGRVFPALGERRFKLLE